MSNIFGGSPSATIPTVSFYSIDQGKLLCDKLWVVVCIFMEISQTQEHMRERTSHPIHEFTKNLWELTARQTVAVGELEYINWALQEVTSDLKKSGDAWVKERVSTALSVMTEAVGGNYTIESSFYNDFSIHGHIKVGSKGIDADADKTKEDSRASA